MPMTSPHSAARDELAGVVHLDSRRVVLVYRRRYGGRDYLRWRVWHRHTTRGLWYPDRWRGGVLPLESAEAFAGAILNAVRGVTVEPPAWLADNDAH